MRVFRLSPATLILLAFPATNAFVHPRCFGFSLSTSTSSVVARTSTKVDVEVDKRTGKPTGTSFLPEETLERAKAGSPVEKVKLAKDGTSAFVDVYEYARKIREGEMTWEEVEKADLDSVRHRYHR